MEKVIGWKLLFQRWPNAIPKLGIVVTSVNESVVFCNFLVSDQNVLLERDRPDALGARTAIVPWEDIVTVKLTSPIEMSRFHEMGFRTVGQ